jgi:hypothetical protein
MYNISRTTVRHILSHLRARRADQVGSDYDHSANRIMTMALMHQPRWPNRTVSLSRLFHHD